MSAVYSPPWQEIRTSMAASSRTSLASLTVGTPLADLGRGRTRLGGGEEDRIDQIEVPLLAHALHEDRADHTAPADDAYLHLSIVAGSR